MRAKAPGVNYGGRRWPATDPIVRRVRCPHCGSRVTYVYRTIPAEDASRIQYRRCRLCELTFKTVREPAEDPLPPDRRSPRQLPRRQPRPRSSRP